MASGEVNGWRCRGYDRMMDAVAWMAVALAVAVGLTVIGLWRRPPGGRQSAVGDLGSVSEGWLSEQRGRKDS